MIYGLDVVLVEVSTQDAFLACEESVSAFPDWFLVLLSQVEARGWEGCTSFEECARFPMALFEAAWLWFVHRILVSLDRVIYDHKSGMVWSMLHFKFWGKNPKLKEKTQALGVLILALAPNWCYKKMPALVVLTRVWALNFSYIKVFKRLKRCIYKLLKKQITKPCIYSWNVTEIFAVLS